MCIRDSSKRVLSFLVAQKRLLAMVIADRPLSLITPMAPPEGVAKATIVSLSKMFIDEKGSCRLLLNAVEHFYDKIVNRVFVITVNLF